MTDAVAVPSTGIRLTVPLEHDHVRLVRSCLRLLLPAGDGKQDWLSDATDVVVDAIEAARAERGEASCDPRSVAVVVSALREVGLDRSLPPLRLAVEAVSS